jgi:hypothetical protein
MMRTYPARRFTKVFHINTLCAFRLLVGNAENYSEEQRTVWACRCYLIHGFTVHKSGRDSYSLLFLLLFEFKEFGVGEVCLCFRLRDSTIYPWWEGNG